MECMNPPYQCGLCHGTFANKSSFTRHRNRFSQQNRTCRSAGISISSDYTRKSLPNTSSKSPLVVNYVQRIPQPREMTPVESNKMTPTDIVDQCGVCRTKVTNSDVLFKPILLSCLHNLCVPCCEKAPAATITCTICSIPTNLSLTSPIALPDNVNTVPLPDRCTRHGKCKKKERCWRVAKRCADDECKMKANMCLACAKTHHDVHDHNLEDIPSITPTDRRFCEMQTQQCHEHVLSERSPLTYYCETCKRTICGVCTQTGHGEHNTVTVVEHNEKKQSTTLIKSMKMILDNKSKRLQRTSGLNEGPIGVQEGKLELEKKRREKLIEVEKMRVKVQTSLDRAIRTRIEQIEGLSKVQHDKLDKIVQKQAILNHIAPKITQADKGNLPPSMRDVVMMNVQMMNENMKDGPELTLTNGLTELDINEKMIDGVNEMLNKWRTTTGKEKVVPKPAPTTARPKQEVRTPGPVSVPKSAPPRAEKRPSVALLRDQNSTPASTVTPTAGPAAKRPKNEANVPNSDSDEDGGRCDVCNSSDNKISRNVANDIVFCDGCNVAVHQECYGLMATELPEGEWYCTVCLTLGKNAKPPCALCPNTGGAMKCTKDGKTWGHVSCVMFIPESSFGDPVAFEPIFVDNVPKDRKALKCTICHQANKGACIQCTSPKCLTAYHVSCALRQKYVVQMTGFDDSPVLKSYCTKHAGSTKRKSLGVFDEWQEPDEGSAEARRRSANSIRTSTTPRTGPIVVQPVTLSAMRSPSENLNTPMTENRLNLNTSTASVKSPSTATSQSACRVCKLKTPVPMSCSKCGLHVHLGCTLPLLSAKIKIKKLPLVCRLCKTDAYSPIELSSKDYLSNVTKEHAELVFKGEQLLLAYLIKSETAIPKEKYLMALQKLIASSLTDFDDVSGELSNFLRKEMHEPQRLQFMAVWLKLAKFCKKDKIISLRLYSKSNE